MTPEKRHILEKQKHGLAFIARKRAEQVQEDLARQHWDYHLILQKVSEMASQGYTSVKIFHKAAVVLHFTDYFRNPNDGLLQRLRSDGFNVETASRIVNPDSESERCRNPTGVPVKISELVISWNHAKSKNGG